VKLVFLGTAAFAVPSLRKCAQHHDVVAVITQPERPGSRGRAAARPVADAARSLGIDLWQPARLREPATEQRVLSLADDALVVAAYGQIIPEKLLLGPRYGGINVHASLLPRWRGAAPVAAALLAGDTETGVSIMQMERSLDTGPVYLQRRVTISGDATTPSLTETLAELGADALIDVLCRLRGGDVTPVPQDDSLATYAPRLTRADAHVDWATHSAVEVDRRVRALQPWPGVVAPLAGAEVQILAGGPAGPCPGASPGHVVRAEAEAVVVATREEAYRVDAVRPPGGRTMSPAAYLRGRRATSVTT
jgi:methionyl-tRNA formyltransferase